MKQSRRRRKRSAQAQNGTVSTGGVVNDTESEEQKIIKGLVEAFSLSTIEEAESAFKEANGDPIKAAEMLIELSDNNSNSDEVAYQASCSSSSNSCSVDTLSTQSLSDNSDGFTDSSGMRGGGKGRGGKKVVATTGTVSNLLGKEYVRSSRRKEVVRENVGGGSVGGKVDVEEAEQFLCSMLGDDCELNMGVVKDVLCNCGYDVEKALELLLDLSASPSESSGSDKNSSADSVGYPRNIDSSDIFWQLSDKSSDSTSHSSESDIQDSIQLIDYTGRNYAEALVSSGKSRKRYSASKSMNGDDLPQQVLESLFNLPKSTEHEPATMNWKNVVKQMESFAHKRVGLGPSGCAAQQMIAQAVSKGAEYHVFRETARQQWDQMKTCYHKAASAFSNGERSYATYMSEQGKAYSKMARDADQKASMEIFKARNKGIENFLTIDLHGQHVKPAMRLVKLHLLFATYISSVQYIRIITGCGSRGLGKSILKQSVLNLLMQEKIQWKEENQGTVLIKLDGPREFSFLDSGSDSESE